MATKDKIDCTCFNYGATLVIDGATWIAFLSVGPDLYLAAKAGKDGTLTLPVQPQLVRYPAAK